MSLKNAKDRKFTLTEMEGMHEGYTFLHSQ